MRKWFAYGGIAASVILVAFGIGAIVIGVNGYNTVRDEISAQNITATDDAAELTGGALQPGQAITTGAEARSFADVMEHHTLEGDRGQAVCRDGPLPDRVGHGHERRGAGGEGADGSAGRERSPQHVGDRDGADDGAEHVLLRRAGRVLLDRDGGRAPAHRDRLPRPDARRRARMGRAPEARKKKIHTASAAT